MRKSQYVRYSTNTSVYGLDIDKLSLSPMNANIMQQPQMSLYIDEEEAKTTKQAKCCKLCNIFLPAHCWRSQLQDYLDVRAQYVLCLSDPSDTE